MSEENTQPAEEVKEPLKLELSETPDANEVIEVVRNLCEMSKKTVNTVLPLANETAGMNQRLALVGKMLFTAGQLLMPQPEPAPKEAEAKAEEK